ncbi:LapA family protein [Mucilaginibacter sp. RS28]|uniref:LapA family protein n=1 Tax=Mucilaginibacter straminoryzae TaxID=2932774 RepID=A0A9X1X5H6_9SPHI|nr:LapA family protein [Mucilaginibacter straminoryzae]MCJ8209968.1 LapA family protein [Mucilaginibacter straminoryzae]
MRVSTLFAIVVTILITVVIMQNTDEVKVTLLFTDVKMPKLVILTAVAVGSFLVGVIAGRPGKVKRVEMYEHDNLENDEDGSRQKRRPGTLSDEDRDYIS